MTLEAVQAAEPVVPPVVEPAVDPPEAPPEPTFESGEAYFDATQGQQPEVQPEPAKRPSPLDDPRAGQYRQVLKERTAQRQGLLEAAIDELVGYGVPEMSAKRIVNDHKGLLNAQHSDGLQFAGFEAAIQAVEAESEQMRAAFVTNLTKAEHTAFESAMTEVAASNNGTVPWADVGKQLIAVARKGYFSEKDHKAAVIAAFNKGREQRAEVGTASANQPLSIVRSANTSSKAPKTLAEARAMHVRGEISNDTYRDYQTKLS